MSFISKEFYPISQVVDLLECSVDDIIHWATFGCIRLHVKIDGSVGLVNDYLSDESIGFMESLVYETSSDEDEDDRVSLDILYNLLGKYISDNGMVGIDEEAYAKLKFICGGMITEELCEVIGPLEKIKGFLGNYYNKFKDNVNDEDKRLMVYLRGFFGLGSDSFNNFNLIKHFEVNYKEGVNVVVMPENKLEISLLSHETVNFELSDLFLIKKDVLRIKDAIENGVDVERQYSSRNISDINTFKKWFLVSNKEKGNNEEVIIERVSAKARDAIRVLVNKLHPEIKDNPTKLADVLTAEAKAQGVICEFNKSTVSNWMKK